MLKKLTNMFLVTVILISGAVMADTVWDGGGSDDRWLTPENWQGDTLPPNGDRVLLEESGGTILIEAGDTVMPRKILGPTYQSEVTTTMTFTGGSLENTSYWIVAMVPFGEGIINVTGETADIYTRDLKLGQSGGIGTLNITDGVVEVYGDGDNIGLYVPSDDGAFSEGYINLDGGTLIAYDVTIYDGGNIDIGASGLLQLGGDQRTIANDYITGGYITAEDATKTPLVLYDGTNTLVLSPENTDFLLKAWAPSPGDGEFIPEPSVTLSWYAGTNAAQHKVYFGDDPGNLALEATLNADVNSFDPGSLDFGTTYYWRVDEVNGTDVWTGDVWSFTIRGTLAVEEFETYADTTDMVAVWNAASGTTISLVSAPSQGANAMQMTYDHSLAPFYSDASAIPLYSDFSIYGVVSLDIWYYGDPGNSAEKMYVALSDGTNTAVVVSDSTITQVADWNIWRIALTDFTDANAAINMNSIDNISVGFGDRQNPSAGGSGTMVIDNIRLWEPRCLFPPESDINGDCVVDLEDFAQIALQWAQSGIWP